MPCVFHGEIRNIFTWYPLLLFQYLITRARENRKNSRSGPKLRILDRFQTPQNANKSVQQVYALNPIFPKPTNFYKSMMSKKSQTVKSFQTDNVRAPFKCDITVVKALNGHLTCILERQLNNGNLSAAQINYVIIQTLSKNQHFTDLWAVNKRLTRIISNGSLIINPFVWHVWIHWDCKTSGCSRRVQKIKGRFTESDKNAPFERTRFLPLLFCFDQHGLSVPDSINEFPTVYFLIRCRIQRRLIWVILIASFFFFFCWLP